MIRLAGRISEGISLTATIRRLSEFEYRVLMYSLSGYSNE